jgi:hypothetical protein
MAYLGRQPIIGNYQVLDAITASATATYALTKNSVAVFPQTPANCIVSLNGVIQAPTDSYTISGSNIVFASALTGSDSIDFITVLGDVLNVGTVSDGTIGLAKLSATGTKDATTFLRGDNTFAVAGGTNRPAFYVTMGAQSVATGGYVKLQFGTEIIDTDNAYDNSTNYRFTVPAEKAGMYYFTTMAQSGNLDTAERGQIVFSVSGSRKDETMARNYSPATNQGVFTTASSVLNLSVGDYVEVYYLHTEGADMDVGYGQFGGFKIIT